MARFRHLVYNSNPEGDCDAKRLQLKKKEKTDGEMLRFNNHSLHH